jgi:hypothetical protein
MVLVWRLYRDRWGGDPGATCIEEGIAYPDDLPERDPRGFQTLREYVDDPRNEAGVAGGFPTRIQLRPLSWWLEKRLFTYGYQHRDRCDVVGFNLSFDLGRLASYWAPARGYYRGGWSLGILGRFDAQGNWRDLRYRRRVLVKAIDPLRTLFGWGSLEEGEEDRPDWRGPEARFVDLHTLAFALTDRNLTLEGACAAFGDPYQKPAVRYGILTPRLLRYARADVEHTATLYRSCLTELRHHEGIDLEPHHLYSPATVAAQYLTAMGLQQPMEKFADLDPRVNGWAMSAFFGGRAEARIVRTPVPIAYVDATSMYPTVNALLGTWSLLAATRVVVEDVTPEVRSVLNRKDLRQRCFDPRFWRDHIGVTLVELDHPSGEVLPIRAYYDAESADPGIGINPLRYEGRLWYALPDVIASTFLSPDELGAHSGQVVRTVKRALRLRSVGIQPGLRRVRLRGGPEVDPETEHPFVRMVTERLHARTDQTLSTEDRQRLDLFLKITANAGAYGVLARFDRKQLAESTRVRVFGPDDDPIEASTSSPEDPGPYCFPPVAASITAGARLLLAMLERAVVDAGGTYAFCDTDSMGIVATPRGRAVACPTPDGFGFVKALPTANVRAILSRFEGLNPYDPHVVPSFWKVEHDSLARPLTCYAISAKRYMLYRSGERAEPELVRVVDAHEEGAVADELGAESREEEGVVDWSEHGLGLYLDPLDPELPKRDEAGRRVWIREAWEWVLRGDPAASPPEWADTYAITRFTVSGPRLADWFSGHDAARPRDEWIRPGSFGLLAHPVGFFGPLSRGALPAAAYEPDPRRWPKLSWYDRKDGSPVRVTTMEGLHDPELRELALVRGDVVVQSLGDILRRYRLRPEHKSLAPDGRLATGDTKGLLRRRPIESAPVLTDLTGKEANKLIERLTGEVVDSAEYRVDYGERSDRWSTLVVPILRRMGAEVVAKRTGRSRSAVERAIREKDPTQPHPPTKALYIRAAAEWAAELLRALGIEPTQHALGVIYCYRRELGTSEIVQRCHCGCGFPVPPGHRKWYSEAHRKWAERRRSSRVRSGGSQEQ